MDKEVLIKVILWDIKLTLDTNKYCCKVNVDQFGSLAQMLQYTQQSDTSLERLIQVTYVLAKLQPTEIEEYINQPKGCVTTEAVYKIRHNNCCKCSIQSVFTVHTNTTNSIRLYKAERIYVILWGHYSIPDIFGCRDSPRVWQWARGYCCGWSFGPRSGVGVVARSWDVSRVVGHLGMPLW